MKEYRNNNFSRHLFLVLCCCVTVMIAAIGCDSKDFPPTIDKPNASPASGEITNTDTTDKPSRSLPPKEAQNTEINTDSIVDTPNSVDETAWCLILVNKWNYVPADYEVKLTELANEQLVDERIYPALQQMFDAARNDGVYPVVASGYRTAEKQQNLMDEKIDAYKAEGCSAKEAIAKAQEWVAIPNTSEHQLGIAVDINADGINSTGDEVYKWLDQNAYKFGFILRYPPDKTEITGVINEPWHYRYVGADVSIEIYNQGICLEEYLGKIN